MVDQKESRRKWINYSVLAIVSYLIYLFVNYAADLFLPLLAAIILAYVFKPLVYTARMRGIPRSITVFAIVLGMLGVGVIGFRLIESAIPKGNARIAKQIRVEYQFNKSLASFLGAGDDKKKYTFIYKYLKNEIDSSFEMVNGWLAVDPEELAGFQAWLAEETVSDSSIADDTKREKHKLAEILATNQQRAIWRPSADVMSGAISLPKINVSKVATWVLFPILFFFLLSDNGGAIRFLIRMIPNNYFELSLTVIERVDRALGKYLRGTALECSAVGIVTGFGLYIFGFDGTSAVAIGFISGLLNAIPYIGTAVGLGIGLIYGMTLENVTPMFSFLNQDHLIAGVVITVTVAHLLDNAVFQPVLVGRAVNLHPIVVILAVASGGMIFGVLGILLSIPTVVASKVCAETIHSGLNDYRLI